MKKLLFIILLGLISNVLFSQTKKEIERRIEKTKKEIEQTSRLLKETENSTKQSYSRLELINRKIELRKEFINDISMQVSILNVQLSNTHTQLSNLSTEIKKIKEEYARMVYYHYINRNAYDRLMFILSSDDFNQAYKRISYLQFYADYRKLQIEQIVSKTKRLNTIILSYNKTIQEKSVLLQSKEQETKTLAQEQILKSKEISDLESKQKVLKDDLQKKILIAEKLKKEIERIIAEEQRKLAEQRRRAAEARKLEEQKKKALAKKTNTPIKHTVPIESTNEKVLTNAEIQRDFEEIQLSGKFGENIGKLPWPSANGAITQPFGEHPHPLFPSIKITNNGIDISCSKATQARAVFDGQVSKIIIIPGANSSVLIRHGNYVTVYSNLVNVSVVQGQKIKAKQVIGTIFTDEETDKTTMNFQIWNETTKLDPQKCLIR